ncbi:uncharacterized protein K460DRAFT_410662 [Cucurbitaria berberidis CBS 394.84]|uniref:Uncharacterized protein n=1 Tax=Cucurbitaria berberidis CBS 394.84 TaxID=1168544 RepID=A0A9P4G963_9PLEO|nr:uncharacterized protein K460DRAFT_410662 [Cucurbitaria berberidis CBS 394.84]KAF1841274.1 hypothetical protein K460DRAFT_410662 [Cucurbitaria berberidis CBS 394.84]
MEPKKSSSATVYTEIRTSPLLGLPRELRDRIWDLALEDTEVHIRKDCHIITIVYQNPSYDQPSPDQHREFKFRDTLPRWLLANQQTLSEGLDQFSRKGVCTALMHQDPLPQPVQLERTGAHGNVLLNHVKELSFHLKLAVVSTDFSGGTGGHVMKTKIVPRSRIVDEKAPIYPKPKFAYLLPNVYSVHLRIDVVGLEHYARPKLIKIDASFLCSIGTDFTRINISVPRLQLQGTNGAVVPHIAPLYSMYPRLQRALVQLGGHLSRHLGELRLPKPEERWQSLENREALYWQVSEHCVHPCSEYEPSEAALRDSWYEIKDQMDDEVGEWNCEINEIMGKREVTEDEEIVLQYTGLRYWSAPGHDEDSLAATVKIVAERNFKRDVVARLGEKSWFCEETGEVVWVEDEEKGVTGYLRDEDEGPQHKVFLEEPPQRERVWRSRVSCCLGLRRS